MALPIEFFIAQLFAAGPFYRYDAAILIPVNFRSQGCMNIAKLILWKTFGAPNALPRARSRRRSPKCIFSKAKRLSPSRSACTHYNAIQPARKKETNFVRHSGNPCWLQNAIFHRRGHGEIAPGIKSLVMAHMTPQISALLEKAMALSSEERGFLIDRLVESLDDAPAEAGVEAAWDEEIKRRVEDVRSGRVKTIPGEQVLREIAEEFPDER
jgi:putative addiction module component (TIGR02574 family)